MMRCNEANNLFNAYLDGEVTQSEKESMEAHLAACPVCREEMARLSETQAKFKQALRMATEDASPSGQAWAKVRQQITQEQEKAVARILPPQETFWQRMGKAFVIPKRLTWKTATAGVLAVVIIASMAIALPMLTGNDQKLSAAEIALADPEVQAALGGVEPEEIGISSITDSPDNSRVVMTLPPDKAVIADVSIKKQTVTRITTQTADDITEQQVIDIAKADSRIQELLDKGYTLYFERAVELYSSVPEENNMIQPFKYLEASPKDMVGFIGILTLRNYPDINLAQSIYYIVINISQGRVASILDAGNGIITIMTVITGANAIPTFIALPPDPGSVNGIEPSEYYFDYIERTPYRLVAVEIDRTTGRQYATWTWNVTQDDIQLILEKTNADAGVQGLLAQGASIVSINPHFGSWGGGPQGDTTHGFNWYAEVRIDLGEVCYRLNINMTTGRVDTLSQGFLKPKTIPEYEIVLPQN
jgi:anti-sigma factor RsiW